MIGFENLGITFRDNYFIDLFLESFVLENIFVEEMCEYNFQQLMTIFFLLSENSIKERAREIFRLYDSTNKCLLNYSELEFLYLNLFKNVESFSNFITKQESTKKSNITEIKIEEQKYKIDKKVI